MTAADATARQPVWRRVPRPLAIAGLVVAGLLLAWQMFAWLAFDPLVRWALPRALADRGGHQLTLAAARLDPWRLAVRLDGLALRDPQGRPLLQLPTLAVDLDAASVVRWAVVLESVQVDRPVASVERDADGRINWVTLLQAIAGPPDPDADPDAPPPRLLVRRLVLADGTVEWSDATVPDGFRTRADALELSLSDLSTLPEDRGTHTLSATLGNGATLRWKGGFALQPLAADGELAIEALPLAPLAPYLRTALDIAPPGGTLAASLAYRLAETGQRPALQLDRIEARLTGLTLAGGDSAAPSVTLDTVSVTGGRLDLAARALVIDEVSVSGGRVAARLDADGRLDLQRWWRPQAGAAGTVEATAATPPPPAAGATVAVSPAAPVAGTPWQVTLSRVGVEGVTLQFEDRGFATPWRVGSGPLTLGFTARASVGDGPADVVVDDLSLALPSLTLALDGAPAPWFTLGSLSLDGGRLSLADRELALARITLADGRLGLTRDAQGRLPLLDAFRRGASPGVEGAGDGTASGAPAAGATWRLRVAAAQAKGFAVGLEDRSVSPAARLGITGLQAGAENLSEDLDRAVPVSLRLAVASGGTLEASGRVVPGAPSADLRVALVGLSLTPAAPYVTQFSTARLAGGLLGTRGRLRVDGGSWRYDGGVAVYGLGLDEAASGDRLLGWTRLTAPVVALMPGQAKIGEVTVEALQTKIVVSKDRQLNLAQVVRPAPAAAAAPARTVPPSPPYRIGVDRVRVVGGEVDFADLSLALPFGTRIHELNGAVVGLRSDGDAAAEVELDGRVDEYGLARVTGQLRPFDPAAFTDLSVVFRNVEMPTLTPYSATFAGRKIASGRLSLDLQYKVRDRQMQGDNRIVMDRLVLGERVESPDALDLPLDLAVALLQDADGRIDLGLPVTGSLDDPQISVGQIIWKAVVNLLTRIVTAPFRALGALFGASDETLDRVVFDPGASALLPPEREKLDKLAGALARRPGLAIRVQGGLDPVADGAALREQALRRAVAVAAGRPPADGQAPGPIGLSDPATVQALEGLFVQRFGADALVALRQQAADAAATDVAASGPAPAASAAAGAAPRLPALLRQRLLEAEPVDAAQLQALARERAQRIQQALLAQGVPPERVTLGDPVEEAGERDGVPSVLGVDAAGTGAAAASPSAPASTAPAPPPR